MCILYCVVCMCALDDRFSQWEYLTVKCKKLETFAGGHSFYCLQTMQKGNTKMKTRLPLSINWYWLGRGNTLSLVVVCCSSSIRGSKTRIKWRRCSCTFHSIAGKYQHGQRKMHFRIGINRSTLQLLKLNRVSSCSCTVLKLSYCGSSKCSNW